jgi:dTDP-4-amino-4,6-dideoxygalactose transaminase
MQVPLLDLKGQYAKIKQDVIAVVSEVLDSQRCVFGPKIEELEKRIAEISGCEFAVGVSSGTDALLNALMSLEIGRGDEVITSPFTFFATAGCIARTGAKPVFVDIDPKTYNINPGLIEAAVNGKTKAIMPVHLYGQMADMDSIMAVAGQSGLAVIEDAAQSIGSAYKDRKAGSIGTCGALSFFPSKNLGGIGDGGMIVTNDGALCERMKVMRNHGQSRGYHHDYIGGNFRLDAINAAALLVKLDFLEEWSAGRRENAAYYNKRFKDSAIVTPFISDDCETIYNQYVIRVSKRDELLEYLRSKEIGCAVYYPLPLHLQECFTYLGYKAGDFPEAEKASDEVIALPVYPEMTEEMLAFVADTVLEFCD